MFQARYIKEAKMLLKGVKKFVRYKRDLISDERMVLIDEAYAEFEQSVRERDKEKIEPLAKKLTDVCEKSVTDYKSSAWGENVEVVFVAIVIALGVRAYFLQPFKIPTGSMQPTLFGVVAYPGDEGSAYSHPGFLRRTFDSVTRGRTWVNVVAEEDAMVQRIEQVTKFKFFTSTKIHCADGKVYTVKAPLKVAFDPRDGFGMIRIFGALDRSGRPSQPRIHRGQVLARGHVDTGDQVLVDKLSYHFRKPRRGEVFVFTTKDLEGIHMENPDFGSQHYIKRLVAVAGDTLDVKPPRLFINGEVAEEKGMRRVMSQEDGYPGYTSNGSMLHFELADDQFWAMGDNSPNSSDSRSWGPVPKANLVGPAFCVYWPFTERWGGID